MAITLNKHAIRCEEIAIAGGKITPNSSPRMSLYDISVNWRELADATKFKSLTLPEWTEQEEAAAGVINSALTYLQRIGCKNIEQLLKDFIEQKARECE